MQINEILEREISEKSRFLGSSVMSVPSISDIKHGYQKMAFNSDLDLKSCYSGGNSIMDIWNEQHPIIHTWLLLSSISICFLSAIFIMIP